MINLAFALQGGLWGAAACIPVAAFSLSLGLIDCWTQPSRPSTLGYMIETATHARWLARVAGGMEVVVDETSELFDEMCVAVMATVEAIKTKRLVGEDLSVDELVGMFMNPHHLTALEHRRALATLAACAMRYLAEDTN